MKDYINASAYVPWSYCRVSCEHYPTGQKTECPNCKVYQFHQYLRDHNHIVEVGTPLYDEIMRANILFRGVDQLLIQAQKFLRR